MTLLHCTKSKKQKIERSWTRISIIINLTDTTAIGEICSKQRLETWSWFQSLILFWVGRYLVKELSRLKSVWSYLICFFLQFFRAKNSPGKVFSAENVCDMAEIFSQQITNVGAKAVFGWKHLAINENNLL